MFFFWEVCLFVCECSSAVQRDRGKASRKGCKVDMIMSPGRMIDYESREEQTTPFPAALRQIKVLWQYQYQFPVTNIPRRMHRILLVCKDANTLQQ